jgi:hypothetical protein
MQGYREYVAACCRGTTVAALLIASPFAVPAAGVISGPAPSSSLGAHTLQTQSEGLGASPVITQPIATQRVDSALIVFNGGYLSNTSGPEDNYGNHWKQLGNDVPFGNGYGDRFNVKAYVALNAKGGSDHTVSFVKNGYAAGEISVPFIEIKHAGVLQNVSQSYAPTGLAQTSGNVTTTGPATLIAVWWGDGGVKRMTAVPNNGFAVIDSYLKLPDNSGVQCAVAYKQVAAAGTYNVTWAGAPAQGAILWLLAFQSK